MKKSLSVLLFCGIGFAVAFWPYLYAVAFQECCPPVIGVFVSLLGIAAIFTAWAFVGHHCK